MNRVNRPGFFTTTIILNFIFLSFAYPQIAPDNEQLLETVVRDSQIYTSYIYERQLPQYGIAESVTEFDSILAYKFQYVMDSMLVANNIMGASAAIFMPEKGTWLGASGMSHPEKGERIRSDMLFDIGSNTKTFMAAQILLLAEQGLLTLDDPLYKWLPRFPHIDSTTTIRQLLNHTSGISDFSNENTAWGDSINADLYRFWTPEYSLTFVLEPNFRPGRGWSYSNTNYILAGMIIKQATGSDKVSEILRQHILEPLSLDNTFLDIEENLTGELACGWIHDDNTGEWYDYSQLPRTAIYSSLWTSGAMVSNAGDMAKWTRALYGGHILSQTSLNEMFTLVPFNDPVTLGYGLGTMKRVFLGKELWLHGGDTVSYGSQAAYFAEQDVCIVVLLNARNYPYKPWYNMMTEQLFRIILHYYRYPHDKAHACNASLSASFIKPQQDTLKISARINNPESHSVKVFAEIQSTDNAFIDSTMLFDDGMHDDGLSDDGFFGGYVEPLAGENEFRVNIKTVDLASHYNHRLENAARFTTIGPVVFENYIFNPADTEPNPGDRLFFQLTLKNEGLSATAVNVAAELVSLDTLVRIDEYSRSFGNILPGEMITSRSIFRMEISKNCPDSTEIPVAVKIKSNEYPFWGDTLSVQVVSPPSIVIENAAKNTPKQFVLYQNYPNPFNATTIIAYQLPIMSHVELDIYSITGDKIVTLVSEKQPVGHYKYEWDAANLASGVYFYTIIAGDFMQSKKLILLK
ncbi:T9SS C-terminal target domain-containing protein [candidate division KSB1 bacterium]|nr:serine hydrolase [candidate division KSB1 bacterium]RQW03194.1 MAG: T9SS C-terminal target domain-containing protein [candidate division KSB1 bacterium]